MVSNTGMPIERRRISRDMERFDVDGSSAFIEVTSRAETLVWTTRRTLADAAALMRPFIDALGADSAIACVMVAPTGYTQREVGRELASKSLEQVGVGIDGVALMRLELQMPGIGNMVLGFTKEVAGVSDSSGAFSVTAPELDHQCIQDFFQTSAPEPLSPLFGALTIEADRLRAGL